MDAEGYIKRAAERLHDPCGLCVTFAARAREVGHGPDRCDRWPNALRAARNALSEALEEIERLREDIENERRAVRSLEGVKHERDEAVRLLRVYARRVFAHEDGKPWATKLPQEVEGFLSRIQDTEGGK